MFLDPRNEVKSPYKAKHEEKLKETLNWSSSAETSSTGRTDAKASVHPMVVGRTDALGLVQVCTPLEIREDHVKIECSTG